MVSFYSIYIVSLIRKLYQSDKDNVFMHDKRKFPVCDWKANRHFLFLNMIFQIRASQGLGPYFNF